MPIGRPLAHAHHALRAQQGLLGGGLQRVHQRDAKHGRARHARAAKRSMLSVLGEDPRSVALRQREVDVQHHLHCLLGDAENHRHAGTCQHTASTRGDAHESASVQPTVGIMCACAAREPGGQGHREKQPGHLQTRAPHALARTQTCCAGSPCRVVRSRDAVAAVAVGRAATAASSAAVGSTRARPRSAAIDLARLLGKDALACRSCFIS